MSRLALPESLLDAWDMLTSSFRDELMFMARSRPSSRTIVIHLANFRKLVVPLSWIEENYPDSAIDPDRLSIRGFGQILFLGDCEVDLIPILKSFK